MQLYKFPNVLEISKNSDHFKLHSNNSNKKKYRKKNWITNTVSVRNDILVTRDKNTITYYLSA